MTFRETVTETWRRPLRLWHLCAAWAAMFAEAVVLAKLGWHTPDEEWHRLMAFALAFVLIATVLVFLVRLADTAIREAFRAKRESQQ